MITTTKKANYLRDGDTIETVWGFNATLRNVAVRLEQIENKATWRTFFNFTDPDGVDCASSIDRDEIVELVA